MGAGRDGGAGRCARGGGGVLACAGPSQRRGGRRAPHRLRGDGGFRSALRRQRAALCRRRRRKRVCAAVGASGRGCDRRCVLGRRGIRGGVCARRARFVFCGLAAAAGACADAAVPFAGGAGRSRCVCCVWRRSARVATAACAAFPCAAAHSPFSSQ